MLLSSRTLTLGPCRPGHHRHRGPRALHPDRRDDPDAGRRASVHDHLRAPGHRRAWPILLTRTPYASDALLPVRPRADLSRSEGFIFVYQDVRGKYQSEGEFVNVRPYNPKKTGTDSRRGQRHLRHHRLAGEERPPPQRQGGAVSASPTWVLHDDGHPERPPEPGGGLAPGAGHQLVPRRRLQSQRRLLSRRRLCVPVRFGQPRPAPTRAHARLRHGDARRLRLPGPGRVRTADRHRPPQGRHPVLDRVAEAPRLRRLVEGAGPRP